MNVSTQLETIQGGNVLIRYLLCVINLHYLTYMTLGTLPSQLKTLDMPTIAII